MDLMRTSAIHNSYAAATDREKGPPSSYAFLVHSQVSLGHSVLPVINHNLITRQKRRRTSQQDHAILEAAYQQNSRPDKPERSAIVDRVSLGEKEVQIWFQNRRQNDRRKSKPMMPCEMMPLLQNSIPMELLLEPTSASLNGDSSQQSSFSVHHPEPSHPSSSEKCDGHSQSTSRASSIHDLLNPMSPPASSFTTSFESDNGDQKSAPISQSPIIVQETGSMLPFADSSAGSTILSSHPNKPDVDDNTEKSAQFAAPIQTVKNMQALRPTIVSSGASPEKGSSAPSNRLDRPPSGRKRGFDEVDDRALPCPQSSRIRLAMALDGAVKVKTTDEETPSPPKRGPHNLPALPKEGFRRSHSAVEASELLKEGQKNKAMSTGGMFGRSRDARVWEFYCDGDARAALSARAKNEDNGSAVGAINLIRHQNRNPKSTPRQGMDQSVLRPVIRAGKQKPKLTRAMSSMARLPGNLKDVIGGVAKPLKTSHTMSTSGDSDKENWLPGTRSSNHPLRRNPSVASTSQDVLQHCLPGGGFNMGSLKGSHENKQRNSREREDGVSGANNGFPAYSFTRSDDKEEDLDCIQGLLSLSQGAWR